MIIYLEDTWTDDNEADDIIRYAEENNYELKILSPDELYKLSPKDFFSGIYFCNTDIVQKHLKYVNRMEIVPDTYCQKYEDFYMRQIEKMTFEEYTNKYNNIKRFIKPATNDKKFSGKVIKNVNDLGMETPSQDDLIYTAEPITFLHEVRLLIGNHKLYGYGNMSENKNHDNIDNKKLITNLEEITDDFRCVDIGLIKKDNKFEWCIIEINPPFSLDDYDMPFEDYIRFCIDACKYINSRVVVNASNRKE